MMQKIKIIHFWVTKNFNQLFILSFIIYILAQFTRFLL